MKKKNMKIWSIFLRYAILILIAVPNLWIFYAIFTPLTLYPSYFIMKIFFSATSFSGTTLFIDGKIPIELIKACIAGAAYYLLLIFNLSIPGIKIKKRISMILFSSLALLTLNIFRIVALVFVFVSGDSLFDLAHEIFWYALSTIFVVGIWFAEVKIYKIKEIPVYSDIKSLLKNFRR